MSRSDKGVFKFSYTQPSLDWFKTINVEIKPNDYQYFCLQRRYGQDWWLIGENQSPKNYKWEEKEIGRISTYDIARFIKWAKVDGGGSKIIEISVINGTFDIFDEIEELFTKTRRKIGGAG